MKVLLNAAQMESALNKMAKAIAADKKRGGAPLALVGIRSRGVPLAQRLQKKLRALGVSSAKRSPFLPNVPAISEAIPGFSGDLWIAFFAAKGVPTDIVDKLANQIQIATSSADVGEKYNTMGIQKLNGGPDKLAALLSSDLNRWKSIVKNSGASID